MQVFSWFLHFQSYNILLISVYQEAVSPLPREAGAATANKPSQLGQAEGLGGRKDPLGERRGRARGSCSVLRCGACLRKSLRVYKGSFRSRRPCPSIKGASLRGSPRAWRRKAAPSQPSLKPGGDGVRWRIVRPDGSSGRGSRTPTPIIWGGA